MESEGLIFKQFCIHPTPYFINILTISSEQLLTVTFRLQLQYRSITKVHKTKVRTLFVVYV